ncbi:hypothetical protein ACIFOC_00390 [Leucobacter aridicollis]|uniref:hypothetical protein n=1 Tax=Leucobacter aridicollis TaxID=283878 RepID=UPI0037CC96BB
MSVLVEPETGAQIMPEHGDDRAHMNSWIGHQACDADLRAKNTLWREIAADLEVRRE